MTLLNQIMAALSGWATMSSMSRDAAMITVLISIWKSSLLQPLWAKMGAYQALVAPILAVAMAMVTLPGGITLANLWAGLQGGALAIGLHELLSVIEALPGIGPMWSKAIAWFSQLLLAPAAPSTNTPPVPPSSGS